MTHRTIRKINGNRGFTLLETLIYLALLAVIIGSGVVAAYHVISSSESMGEKTIVQEEGNFLLAKIDWALSGVSFVTVPALSATSSSLTVQKVNFAQNPLVIDASSSRARVSRAGATAVTLTNDDAAVDDLVFTHLASPEGVKASFTVRSRAATPGTGILFETTRYLRK